MGLTLGLCSPAVAFEEASGVNLSLEEGFGARHQAMALRFAGFGSGADVVGHAPASMNDVDDFTFSTAHAERFAQSQLDHFALLMPLDAQNTLGLALARYGVSDIEWRPVGSEATALPPALFNTADYWVTAAFARRLGALDLGASLQWIYRDLDQSGMGLRGDVMAAYSMSKDFRIQALLVGAIPSSARWSSGLHEYESPDLRLGITRRGLSPYLYGQWQIAFETEGLFQKSAKSNRTLNAYRGALHPAEALGTANLGGEFLFDFGLSLRAGIEEIRFSRSLAELWHAGIGYSYRGMVGIDYSFTPHPDLPTSHRLALQWTPVFPKFSGKNYRGTAPQAKTQSIHPRVEPLESSPTYPAAEAPAMAPNSSQAPVPEPKSNSSQIPGQAPAQNPPSQAPSQAPTPTPSQVPTEPIEKEELEVLEE